MSQKEEVKPLKVKAKQPSIKTKSNEIHKVDLGKKEEVKFAIADASDHASNHSFRPALA